MLTAMLLLSAIIQASSDPADCTSRTLRDGGKDWEISFTERRAFPDGSVEFRSRGVRHDGEVVFMERRYNAAAEPLSSSQEGPWGRLEAHYEQERVIRTISGKEQTEKITRKTFVNPTVFWFWKHTPKPEESVTVTFAAANHPSTFQIRYTYIGTEEIESAGRKVKAHKVREDPLNLANSSEVYTVRWFDEQGMDIGRFHKANKNEYRTTLLRWR
jgi:hypothetical protein